MKSLRAILTGWPALLSFLVAPTLAVLLSHDGEWKRWLPLAPFVAGYVWITWPHKADDGE